MARIIISTDKCKGCELCINVCPKKIIGINKAKINAIGHNPAEVSDMSKCIGCAFCATICPDCVIEVRK